MKKAFEEGWGAVICKTFSLDSSKVNNVTPRYARSKAADGTVIGCDSWAAWRAPLSRLT